MADFAADITDLGDKIAALTIVKAVVILAEVAVVPITAVVILAEVAEDL